MANIPTVEFVKKEGHTVVCVLTSADMYNDGFKGVNYVNYDVDTNLVVGYGQSKGYGPDFDGCGSMITGIKNAKAAANRYLVRKLRRIQP